MNLRNAWVASLFVWGFCAFAPIARAADEELVDLDVYLAHANDQINRPAATDTGGSKSASGFTLGLKVESPIGTRKLGPVPKTEWRVYALMLLSKRAFEESAENGEEPDESATTLLRTADTGEFYLGLRPMWRYGGTKKDEGAFYVRVEFGGIARREDEGEGDLLNNHFVGVGLERLGGRLNHSLFEIGSGQSELFAKRSGRGKARLHLEYALSEPDTTSGKGSTTAVFVSARADTDLGGGADSIRLLFGLRVDADEALSSITGLFKTKQ